MFETVITILVVLLVAAILYWAALRLMAAFGIGEPIKTVVIVIIIIVALLFILRTLGVM